MTSAPAADAPSVVNLANLATLYRIALSPLFVVFFLAEGVWARVAVLALALSFEVSDVLDGYLARKLYGPSDFGALFDPFADSVCRFTIFLCFMEGRFAHLWMVALIFFRDATVSFLRVLAAKRGIVLSARLSGKLKAVVQGIAIFAVNSLALAESLGRVTDARSLGLIICGVVAVVTVLSGVDYFVANLRVFRPAPSA